VVGGVHTSPLKLPPDADHVSPFVAPPLAVAIKVWGPDPTVSIAGEIGMIVTGSGVAVQVVTADDPLVPITVRMNVVALLTGALV
jgi:hypothetical protein